MYQRRKDSQSKEECTQEGIEFVALPMEVLGGFSSKSIEIVNKLGRQLARQTGKEESEVINHTFQRLSIYLMKANAALMSARLPYTQLPPQNIDGDQDMNL